MMHRKKLPFLRRQRRHSPPPEPGATQAQSDQEQHPDSFFEDLTPPPSPVVSRKSTHSKGLHSRKQSIVNLGRIVSPFHPRDRNEIEEIPTKEPYQGTIAGPSYEQQTLRHENFPSRPQTSSSRHRRASRASLQPSHHAGSNIEEQHPPSPSSTYTSFQDLSPRTSLEALHATHQPPRAHPSPPSRSHGSTGQLSPHPTRVAPNPWRPRPVPLYPIHRSLVGLERPQREQKPGESNSLPGMF
ncbi:hypothetical protein JCM3765_000756 [Sporobolomyces pararoseus]